MKRNQTQPKRQFAQAARLFTAASPTPMGQDHNLASLASNLELRIASSTQSAELDGRMIEGIRDFVAKMI